MDQPNKVKSLDYFYRHKIPLIDRGINRCKIGDTFRSRGKIWRVVEVIPYGMYPSPRPKLKVQGFYREYESYIVEDEKGNQRWPIVGTLLKMKKVG